MRGWANAYIEKLQQGETVKFRPRGNSMAPKIKSGQLVTVEPVKGVREGDVVLCQVKGKQWLHLVTAIMFGQDRIQISNNKGHVNGWTTRDKIYGVVTSVED
jgi:hypothetical protein